MSNWFENNATKSIIIYTLTLLAAAYATMYFVLDENKERNHLSDKENLITQIQTLHERISILESDNQTLREENQKQVEWLQNIPGTSAFFEKKIVALEKKLSSRDSLNGNMLVNKLLKYNFESSLITRGNAFVDELTRATLGINKITLDREASGIINLPGKSEEKFLNKIAGNKWSFYFQNRKFELTITEINWAGDKYRVKVSEM
jgi:hypothetical protein